MRFEYPYTNFHEMNLDWIIEQVKKLGIQFDEFKVINQITFSGAWDITEQYPAWTIVSDNNIGYISIVPVPAGVTLDNGDYWREVIDYTAQIAGLQDRVVTLENKTIDLPVLYDYVLTVGHGCKYTKINDAVDAMRNLIIEGMPANTIPLILIYPGYYDESVNLLNCPNIHLKGVGDRDSVVITATQEVYPDSPIHVSGSAFIENITMIGSGSYSMHYEYQNGPTSGNVIFNNCKFISNAYSAAGIGMGPECSLSFYNCEFVSTGSPAAGVFFFHNYPYDANNMEINLYNCDIFDTDLSDIHTIRWDDVSRSTTSEAGKSILNFRTVNTFVFPNTFEFQQYDGSYAKSVVSGNNGALSYSTGNNVIALNSNEYDITINNTANVLPLSGSSTYSVINVPNANKYNWTVNELYKSDGTMITAAGQVQIFDDNTLTLVVNDISTLSSFVRFSITGHLK